MKRFFKTFSAFTIPIKDSTFCKFTGTSEFEVYLDHSLQDCKSMKLYFCWFNWLLIAEDLFLCAFGILLLETVTHQCLSLFAPYVVKNSRCNLPFCVVCLVLHCKQANALGAGHGFCSHWSIYILREAHAAFISCSYCCSCL